MCLIITYVGPLLFSLYLLSLGSILRKQGVAFHCCAENSQIYIILGDAFFIEPLLLYLDYIKATMAQNVLHFNVRKSEVMAPVTPVNDYLISPRVLVAP